jgi:adenine-specific DNA-methyltransferase
MPHVHIEEPVDFGVRSNATLVTTLPLDNIFNGDCVEFLRTLPDSCVDLVVSSPPYNLGKEYEAKRALEVYIAEQAKVLTECARVLKATGSIFWQVGSFSDNGVLIPLDIRIFPILEALGLKPRNRIAWVRQHGLHARKKFSCRYETILWFTKSDQYVFDLDSIRVPQKWQNKKHYRGERRGELSCNPNGKNPGDIWLFRNVKHNHEEQTVHPCQFPEDLIARIVLAVTKLGDVVLDPYMGTGTVAVVSRDHGRHFMGAEIETRYHTVALRRLCGKPDENNSFPNLKTLRDYVERTGDRIEKFRFDMQVGNSPTERSKSKIYPEEHHLAEMEERVKYEEAAFAADIREEERPVDVRLNGGATTSRTAAATTKSAGLFEGVDS